MLASEIVDWNALGQVVLYALIAGVGVPAVFAVAVFGAARSTDPHRERGGVASVLFAFLAVVGAAICVASVVFGIYLMTQK